MSDVIRLDQVLSVSIRLGIDGGVIIMVMSSGWRRHHHGDIIRVVALPWWRHQDDILFRVFNVQRKVVDFECCIIN